VHTLAVPTALATVPPFPIHLQKPGVTLPNHSPPLHPTLRVWTSALTFFQSRPEEEGPEGTQLPVPASWLATGAQDHSWESTKHGGIPPLPKTQPSIPTVLKMWKQD
jgi:hypothetical protein